MIRLDKMLSNMGYGSRKDVKKMIRNKAVSINGQIVTDDDYKVNEECDEVSVYDDLVIFQKDVYIMLNKPDGYISANEDLNDPVVFDLIDDQTKGLFCVGRLDKDTEGLLLICNDGKLAHQLLSPKKNVYKKYYVETQFSLNESDIELLTSGTICLDDNQLQPAIVEMIDNNSLYLSIKEGKYHQVKRMLEACKNKVTYLKRVEMASLVLDETLALGEYRYLDDDEVATLKQL